MTIDEAIRHAEEVAEIKEKQVKNGDWEKDSLTERNCIKCAEEHRQLVEWLKDYKRLKEQPEITWVTGTDGAKVAFSDVPIPKVLKICEILQEPTITSTEDNAEMTYPQVEGITPTVVLNETQEQLDFVQPHKRIPVMLTVESDCISRQEAIDTIRQLYIDLAIQKYVIDILKALPSVKPQESCDVPDTNVGDIISKQTVLDTISELNAISFYEAQEDSKETYYEIRQAIKDLSPVKLQEPKTGHWVKGKCDQCGGHAPFWSMATTYYESEYCPKCGCKMVEPQETKQPEISSYYGLKSYVRERSEE